MADLEDPQVCALLGWYEEHARDLPWRRTRDPYAILVSEVMLQQTQVARVVERWTAWIARWPTAEALAVAARADVLGAWVGLGYNRRAVRLHEACAVVARGGWPADLRTLPGIGPYTAAAVGSFAFDRQEVCVDTNVSRLFARLGAPLEPPPGLAATFNQATMELGARVCTARDARCAQCPLAAGCRSAFAVEIPARAPAGAGPRGRFEDSNRWVRGRVVAALAAGRELPGDIPADRLAAAVDGLVRDGLVRRDGEVLRL